MNKDNAKDFLPLVQALADGKMIQELSGNTWTNLTFVGFVRDPQFYRIKPEPRRIWVNEYTKVAYGYNSKESAEIAGLNNCNRIAVEYVEVLP